MGLNHYTAPVISPTHGRERHSVRLSVMKTNTADEDLDEVETKNTIETEIVLHLEQLGLGGPAFEPCAEFSGELGAVLRLGGLKPQFGPTKAKGAPISTNQ
jgi:hypothetical protein